jgi:hypothetical protein
MLCMQEKFQEQVTHIVYIVRILGLRFSFVTATFLTVVTKETNKLVSSLIVDQQEITN